MLSNTFLHLPGIGRKKERELWKAGILTWDDFERAFHPQASLFPGSTGETRQRLLDASRQALIDEDAEFFAVRLPSSEHYRIALTFPERTAFLDIETTGLSHYYDEITVIGVSLDDRYSCYVRGSELKSIGGLLDAAKVIVTFNGTIFDLRFIRNEFPKLKIPKAHVDLRFAAKSVGLRGGQKAIERELDVQRTAEIEEVIGERAPLLWHEYRLGDHDAAQKLVTYNHADVEGMKIILDSVVERRRLTEKWPRQLEDGYEFSRHVTKIKWARSEKTVAKNRIFVPKFRGRRGPEVRYQDLAQGKHERKLRLVGIDLTGSAKRATGWCLLNGRRATTALLSSDDEIVEETANAQPDLISIDSPLSLPKGRVTVRDDDPGRDEFGIMRECERELKRRGVNVYPSLIPSMQALTERGIRLAQRFRSMGLPVIESYPGAAQDIMSIPRKRAGLDYLKKGLGDFGIKGDFLHHQATHDEVDAVTSAVVGLFFWSGKFEALGNDDEDYLIIPDLRKSPDPWRRRRVIGISGPIAAGKTTAAMHIEAKSFAYARYSQVLAEMLEKEGTSVNRKTLQALGDEVHSEPGQRWLCKKLIDRMPNSQNVVIDGLRFPEDHAFLVESFGPGYAHIHILAAEDLRETRYLSAGYTAEEFRTAIAHRVESKVRVLKRLAHCHINNESSIIAFRARVTRTLNRLLGSQSDSVDKPQNMVAIAPR